MDTHVRAARIGLVCLAVVSATTVAGSAVIESTVAEAASAAHPSATVKRVVSARSTTPFAMPAPGLAKVQLVRLTAGAWTVIAKATAVNFSTTDFVRCQLWDITNNVGLDGSTYQVGTTVAKAGPITNVATLEVPPGATVQVQQQCGHDTAAGDAAYLDADAGLVAFQTLDGTAAGQSVARTAAPYPLTSSNAIVLSLALPPGTYAIGFKMTAVSLSGNAVVLCYLLAPNGGSGTADIAIGDTSAAATDTAFTYFSGSGTVSLVCGLPAGSGAYLDPETVLWARKAKAVTAVENGCGARLVNATTDLVALVRQGQCTIVSTNTALSAASVSKGTWVAVGGESTLANDGASDFVRCELRIDGGQLDGSATWEDAGHYVGGLTVLGTVKLAQQANIEESCIHDTSGATSRSFAGSLVLIRV